MSHRRIKILLFGYLPPPYFGPSTAYQALLRSEFVQGCDITFINLSVVTDVRELEKFKLGKLVKLAKFIALEFGYLLTRRFDFVCYPVSFNSTAFLKDALLLGLARAFGVPTVLWAHGNNLPDFYSRSSRWLQRIIDRTLKGATAAIVLGERLRFNFQQHLADDRIFVVPLGIETPPQLLPLLKHDAPLTVLYLGNLIREKGVLVLLEAIPRVVARRPKTRFKFAGAWWREEERQEAQRLIRESKIEEQVEFVGVTVGEAKQRLLAESDILVFPTFYYNETFGLVLLEAMAAGLPVIATSRASIPEIIEDGVNGLLVEEQDPNDLAVKILQLAENMALREQMGRANRQRFAGFYTHQHYGRRMIQVFETLASHPPVPTGQTDG
jgi:glycosyltransferase involved in cell wall biosynthesis